MLPIETIEALFPSAGRVGNITLHPLTVGRAALLETLGMNCAAGVSADDILLAAWVLSLTDAEVVDAARSRDCVPLFQKWCEKYNPDLYELGGDVVCLFVAAFSTYVPAANETNARTIYATETGFGWPLEIAETLCHEYGLRFDEALATPLSRAYGMICCARQRNGIKNGAADYYGRIADKQAAEQLRKAQEAARQANEKNEVKNG